MVSLLTCLDVYYLYLMAFSVNKNKYFRLLDDIYHSSSCCAIPVLNISIRAFIWHSGLLELHDPYFIIAMYIFIFVLTMTVDMMHTSSSTVLSLLYMCRFNPLSSLLMRKEGLKGKALRVVLSFSFLLRHYFQHNWLANTGSNRNRKGYDMPSWSFVFLWVALPYFCV